jgi:hypothetical protein
MHNPYRKMKLLKYRGLKYSNNFQIDYLKTLQKITSVERHAKALKK